MVIEAVVLQARPFTRGGRVWGHYYALPLLSAGISMYQSNSLVGQTLNYWGKRVWLISCKGHVSLECMT